jgi:hypothetical protein
MATVSHQIAVAAVALRSCQQRDIANPEWEDRWDERLTAIAKNALPRGSGFDSGTKIVAEKCTEEKLVLTTAFHHMDTNGFYDGWTEHTVTVTPSFIGGFNIKVSGRDRNNIKDYIAETLRHALDQPYEWPV